MKSEHRHELKTNELAEWIANFPRWAKQNARIIIYVSAVAVLVISLASWRWYRKNIESVKKQLELTSLAAQLSQTKLATLQAQAQGVDLSYMFLPLADKLHAAAQNTTDDRMAAFALIKQAETLRTELHYRLGAVGEQEMTAQISRARDAYTEALTKASNSPSLTALAKFGLGLCEEELGNFDHAQQIYREITTNPDLESTTAAVQAKQRLNTMADYKQKLIFKAAGEPAQTRINFTQPLEINLPNNNP